MPTVFCYSDHVVQNQVLEGDRLTSTPYSLKFRVDVENEVLCTKMLKEDEMKKFWRAVSEDYYFQVCVIGTSGLLHALHA
jgi:hypothetical protein